MVKKLRKTERITVPFEFDVRVATALGLICELSCLPSSYLFDQVRRPFAAICREQGMAAIKITLALFSNLLRSSINQ
jgi:hypothetical protein